MSNLRVGTKISKNFKIAYKLVYVNQLLQEISVYNKRLKRIEPVAFIQSQQFRYVINNIKSGIYYAIQK